MATSEINSFTNVSILRWLDKCANADLWSGYTDANKAICEWKAGYRSSEFILEIVLNTPNACDWVSAALLGLANGCRLWFIPPSWSDAETRKWMRLIEPHLVLNNEGWSNFASPEGEDIDRDVVSDSLPVGSSAQLLIPTGGSSGKPKFALHDLSTLLAAYAGVSRYFNRSTMQKEGFAYCLDLPVWHVSGWMQVVRSFLSHSTLFIGENSLHNWMRTTERKSISMVSSQLQRAIQDKNLLLDVLKVADIIVIGGGPCAEVLLRQALDFGIHPYVTYGMTETLGMIAGKKIESERDLERGAEIFPHAEIEIKSDQSESSDCEDEDAVSGGEILVSSGALTHGIVSISSTRSKLGLKWVASNSQLATRDLGLITIEGELHVHGRMDHLIITGGEKVNPTEVEQFVLKHPLVQECIVWYVPDLKWGQKVACIYKTEYDTIDEEDFRQSFKGILESFKRPKLWARIDRIPFDSKGKISKQVKDQLFAETFAK